MPRCNAGSFLALLLSLALTKPCAVILPKNQDQTSLSSSAYQAFKPNLKPNFLPMCFFFLKSLLIRSNIALYICFLPKYFNNKSGSHQKFHCFSLPAAMYSSP